MFWEDIDKLKAVCLSTFKSSFQIYDPSDPAISLFAIKVNKINNTHCNQYDIHSLNEYKIPKILVIQNYTIPSQIYYLENYAMYSIFFTAHCLTSKKISQQLGMWH
jgi:hypothetical protein